MRKRTVPGRLAWLLVIGVVLGGCATTRGALPCNAAQESPFKPYQGPDRLPLQVVEIRIPLEDLKRYPDLARKQVGFGLSSLLHEVLSQTQRFDLVEADPEILRKIMDQWEWSRDGVIKMPRPQLKAAAFLVYAKIFDFVVCSPLDDVRLLQKRLTCVTSVGVQVRMVKTMSRQLIVGSTNALQPEGTYCHTVSMPLWGDPGGAFDQSAVGKATYKATRYAVSQLLQSFKEAGWSGEPTP